MLRNFPSNFLFANSTKLASAKEPQHVQSSFRWHSSPCIMHQAIHRLLLECTSTSTRPSRPHGGHLRQAGSKAGRHASHSSLASCTTSHHQAHQPPRQSHVNRYTSFLSQDLELISSSDDDYDSLLSFIISFLSLKLRGGRAGEDRAGKERKRKERRSPTERGRAAREA